MGWSVKQAKQAARLFFGTRALGVNCKLVNLDPQGENWAVVGEVIDDVSVAAVLYQNGVNYKVDALWSDWNGQGADSHLVFTDAESIRWERGPGAQQDDDEEEEENG